MAIAPQGSAPPTRTAAPYAAAITENIEHVRRKIRLADLGRGLLMAGCLVFGYALVVAIFDLSLGGSNAWGPLAIRLTAFAALVVGLFVLAARVGARFLLGVNPYYAARRLEETIPDSKNSVINWLDLKDQPLPPVIQQAVGARAARDVAKADPDLVGSRGELAKLAACAAVLFVGLVVLFALVPRQFGSLMGRAFLPIRTATLVSPTTITVLKPAVDAVVPLNHRVDFIARIEGRIAPVNSPGAPALFYRHTTSDAAVRVPLEEDTQGQWVVRLSPDQVRTGLFWKIVAGDTETPEAQLHVRAAPFITRFEAKYSYRPYRKLADETVVMPNELMPQPRLFGHRGTDVVLKTRANTPVKSGAIELDIQGVKKLLPAELNPAEPETLTFRLGLDRSGSFRIFFDSIDGEKNLDRSPYSIDVLDDGGPMVDLFKPGKDLAAPGNATLLLEGGAIDDFGITGFTLKMTLADKVGGKAAALADLPYKPKTPLMFKNGTYPTALTYMDVVELDQLKNAEGRFTDLRPGNELTYWLEATDNNDFGRPNVGKSRVFKVVIDDTLKPTMERKQAQAQKEQHDKKQSDQHDKQDQQQNDGGAGNQNNGGDNKDPKKDENGKGGSGDGGHGSNSKPEDPKNPDPKKDEKGGQGGASGADGANNDPKKDQKSEPKNDKQQNNAGQGGGSPEERQDKEKIQDLQNKLAKTGEQVDQALKKDPPESKDGKDAKEDDGKGGKTPPPNPGGKGSDPKDDKNPKDPKDDKKAPNGSSSGGEDKSTPKDQKGKGDGDGDKGGPGKQVGKTPDKKADPTQTGDGKGKDDVGKGKPTDKKDDSALKEKGKTSENAKTVESDKKPQNPNPGQAKGNDPGKSLETDPKSDPKAASKEKGGKDQQPPQAKNKDGKGEGDPKSGDGKVDTAQAKGDGAEKKGPPSKDEIDKLKEALKNNAPEADNAAKELAERGQDMKDPQLKKNLEDVLKEFGREEDLKNLQGANNTPEMAPMPKKEGDEKASGVAPKGGVDDNQGTEASPITGSGGRGIADDLKRLSPEEMFARRMGSLQLENLDDLKKRVTPKVLDAANVSDAEWQRFLDNARQYQELMKKVQSRDELRFLRGGQGQMKTQGPRQLDTSNTTRDPLTGGQSLAPPEFRDAERAFTRKKDR